MNGHPYGQRARGRRAGVAEAGHRGVLRVCAAAEAGTDAGDEGGAALGRKERGGVHVRRQFGRQRLRGAANGDVAGLEPVLQEQQEGVRAAHSARVQVDLLRVPAELQHPWVRAARAGLRVDGGPDQGHPAGHRDGEEVSGDAGVRQVQGQSVDLVPAPADSCAEKGRDQQHVVGQREPLGHELGELESDPAQVQKRRRNFKEQENRAVVVDHLGADARQKDGAGHDAVDQKAQPKVLQMAQRHRRVPHKVARGQRAVHFRVRRGRKNAVLVEVFVVEKRDRQHHDQRRLDEGHDPHAEVEPVDFFGDQRPHSGQQTKQPAHQIQAVVEQHTEHQHVQDLQQLAARAVWHNGVQERDPDGNRNAVLARCPKIRNEIHGKVLPCARRALG